MHDHSRFQRDINDVTGVSLSLSLYYYSQKSLTHNIGSASALPIIHSMFFSSRSGRRREFRVVCVYTRRPPCERFGLSLRCVLKWGISRC